MATPNCVNATCVASDPVVNEYGYDYGQIFYKPEEQTTWQFFCKYVYESDALLHNYLNQIENDQDDGTYDNADIEDIECDLLELQFRDFQLWPVKLTALEKETLKFNKCVSETPLITTPAPPQPTGDGQTTPPPEPATTQPIPDPEKPIR